MEGGDLRQLIYKSSYFSASLVRQFMAELVYGLNELHKIGVIHRDLKPANIFLDSKGRAVIGDFGLSRFFSHYAEHVQVPAFGCSRPVDVTYKLCGTPGYIAPEVYTYNGYSFAADVFSLGSIMYEMLYRRHAFDGETLEELTDNVLYSQRDIQSENPVDPITVDFLSAVSSSMILCANEKLRLRLD